MVDKKNESSHPQDWGISEEGKDHTYLGGIYSPSGDKKLIWLIVITLTATFFITILTFIAFAFFKLNDPPEVIKTVCLLSLGALIGIIPSTGSKN